MTMRLSPALFMVMALCASASPMRAGDDMGFFSFAEVPASLPKASLELELRDSVLRALEVDYGVRIERLDYDVSAYRIRAAKSAFDPTLRGAWSEAGQDGGTNDTLRTERAELSLSKEWITGTELRITASHSKADDEDQADGRASISLSQPLLRGAWTTVRGADLAKARRNRDVSREDLRQGLIDTALAMESSYWGLVLARERLVVQEESLKSARELEALTLERAAAGVLSESDTVQAKASVYDRETAVVRAAEAVRRVEDQIKERLTLLQDPDLWQASVVPLTKPEAEPGDVEFLEALRTALDARPDYRIQKLRLENEQLDLTVARNALLPRLDVVGRLERTDEGDPYGAAFSAFGADEDENWSLGLEMSVPLGARSERASRDIAVAQVGQRVLSLMQLEQRIVREVSRAVAGLNTSKAVLESTAKAVEFEERKLNNERAKLELGESTTDNIVRFIDSLNRARLNHVQAITDYQLALSELARIQGTTLTKYGVTLDEEDR